MECSEALVIGLYNRAYDGAIEEKAMSSEQHLSTGEILLHDAHSTLLRVVNSCPADALLEKTFSLWMVPELANPDAVGALVDTLKEHLDNSADYRNGALLGYAVAASEDQGVALGDEAYEMLEGELAWMAGRNWMLNGMPADFFSDAVGILGFAVGARYCRNEELKERVAKWLGGFLPRCCERRGVETWERVLFAAAAYAANFNAELAVPDDPPVADIRLALRLKKALPPVDSALADSDEVSALRLMINEDGRALGPVRAALRITAYDWVRRSAPVVTPGRASIADVVTLLKGIQSSLYRWTWEQDKGKTKGSLPRQWHIDNEYHVQNLLWVVLKPVFPDLEEEVYTEAIGTKRPRSDLVIPSLRLIIEAKFMRRRMTSQDVIGEISEDSGFYLSKNSQYDAIVPFIWDDTPRPQEHEVMVQGMKKIRGIVDVVIVSRPNTMFNEPSESTEHTVSVAEASSASGDTDRLTMGTAPPIIERTPDLEQ